MRIPGEVSLLFLAPAWPGGTRGTGIKMLRCPSRDKDRQNKYPPNSRHHSAATRHRSLKTRAHRLLGPLRKLGVQGLPNPLGLSVLEGQGNLDHGSLKLTERTAMS